MAPQTVERLAEVLDGARSLDDRRQEGLGQGPWDGGGGAIPCLCSLVGVEERTPNA